MVISQKSYFMTFPKFHIFQNSIFFFPKFTFFSKYWKIKWGKMRLYFVIFKHCDLLTLVILQSVTIQWQIVLFFNNPTKKQQNKKRLEIAKFTKDVGVKTANKSVFDNKISLFCVWVKRETRFISVAEWIIVALKTKLIDYLTHLFFR